MFNYFNFEILKMYFKLFSAPDLDHTSSTELLCRIFHDGELWPSKNTESGSPESVCFKEDFLGCRFVSTWQASKTTYLNLMETHNLHF